jgi:hypothetical protein
MHGRFRIGARLKSRDDICVLLRVGCRHGRDFVRRVCRRGPSNRDKGPHGSPKTHAAINVVWTCVVWAAGTLSYGPEMARNDIDDHVFDLDASFPNNRKIISRTICFQQPTSFCV